MATLIRQVGDGGYYNAGVRTSVRLMSAGHKMNVGGSQDDTDTHGNITQRRIVLLSILLR